ncbi:hypothetical protein ACP4OV_005977 [Aristida adscensionis]
MRGGAWYGTVFRSHLFGSPTVVSCDGALNQVVQQNEERLFQCSYPGPVRGILGASNTTGAFLHDHLARYGTVFRSHLFGSPTVVSCDGALNQVVLQNEERLFQCSYPGPVRGILGASSLLVVTGDRHRRIRAMALAFVASTGLRPSYLADVDRAARAVVASWRGRAAVAFCDEARKFAFSVIVEQVLGLSPEEPVTGRILEDYSTFMKGLVSFPLNIPGTPYARAVKARRKISVTLEVVINETMRCGNVVKFLHRKALKGVRYQGYVIPAGWKVLPVLAAVHLDSALHVNPEQFQPCRWEGLTAQTAGKRFAPFGGGARLWPGSELGKVEVTFFLHHLLLNYRWRLDGEDAPMAHPYVEFARGLPLEIEPIF